MTFSKDSAPHVIPSGLELLPFQKEAINKMLYFLEYGPERGCYNACEAGLGKTIQTLAALNKLKARKVLILAPPIMLLTWKEKIMQWSTLKPSIAVIRSSKDMPKYQTADYTLLSYGIASNDENARFLADEDWDALVIDESHSLKNIDSKRTKAVLNVIWHKAKYRIALSGTPMTKGVTDLFSLANKFSPNDFPNFYQFAKTYSYARETPWGTKYYGLKNKDALRNKIRTKFYIRYKKDEVLKDLPEKTYSKIILPKNYCVKLPPETVEELAAIKKEIEITGKCSTIGRSVAESLRLQGEAKVKAVAEFAAGFLEEGQPIIVFAWHKKVVAELAIELSEYSPLTITGETSMADRDFAIKSFQNGDTKLIILNIAAAGVGITLTASSNVIFAEYCWSPALIDQAASRAHRIGQKNAVTCYYFVAEGGSVDEVLCETVMNKARTINSIIEN